MGLLGVRVEDEGLLEEDLGVVELAAVEEDDALQLLGPAMVDLGVEHLLDVGVGGVEVLGQDVEFGEVEVDLAVGRVLLDGLLEFVLGSVVAALLAERPGQGPMGRGHALRRAVRGGLLGELLLELLVAELPEGVADLGVEDVLVAAVVERHDVGQAAFLVDDDRGREDDQAELGVERAVGIEGERGGDGPVLAELLEVGLLDDIGGDVDHLHLVPGDGGDDHGGLHRGQFGAALLGGGRQETTTTLPFRVSLSTVAPSMVGIFQAGTGSPRLMLRRSSARATAVRTAARRKVARHRIVVRCVDMVVSGRVVDRWVVRVLSRLCGSLRGRGLGAGSGDEVAAVPLGGGLLGGVDDGVHAVVLVGGVATGGAAAAVGGWYLIGSFHPGGP